MFDFEKNRLVCIGIVFNVSDKNNGYQFMTMAPSASLSDRYAGISFRIRVHSSGGIRRTGGKWY